MAAGPHDVPLMLVEAFRTLVQALGKLKLSRRLEAQVLVLFALTTDAWRRQHGREAVVQNPHSPRSTPNFAPSLASRSPRASSFRDG